MNKNKLKKKILISISLVFMLLANLMATFSSVKAAEGYEKGDTEYIYFVKDCGELLKYNGTTVVCSYLEYESDGTKYPAYCIDKNNKGAESESYEVTLNGQITSYKLWRILLSGYPYKTLDELGVDTVEEAFTATKHAVYCYYGNDRELYTAVTGKGENTVKALNQILDEAESMDEIYEKPKLTIVDEQVDWMIDENEKDYVSKEYMVEANKNFEQYTVELMETTANIRLTDMENVDKTTFENGQNFKVLIPIEEMTRDASFVLEVSADVKTMPIFYGDPENYTYQSYALFSRFWEEGVETVTQTYSENKTKIIVKKYDKEQNIPLEGVVFDLLDENKEVIRQDLVTDEEGKIEIESIIPGTYYVRETKGLEGYAMYSEDIEVQIRLDEEFTVTVYNEKITIEEPKEPEELVSEKEVTAIERLPVAGL